MTNLDVTVSLEIKHRKAADVPEPIDVDSKFTEKVDDSRDRLHREKFAKLRVHSLGVQLLPPLVRKVVSVLDDSLHEYFRVEHPVLFGNHTPRNRKDTTEEGKVEKDRAVRSNLEMDEKIRVDDGGEKKDGSKGASYECGKSGYHVN